MISLRAATKRYGDGDGAVHAMKDVTLDIGPGEHVCVIGRSGSGKTTLLDVIGTLLTLTSGSYHLDGRNITELPEREIAALRNRHFGFVFQAFHLLDHLTVLENVLMGSQYRRGDADYPRRAARSLEAMGIGHLASRHPQRLSGGEKQRVAIARALASSPSIILADEPTGNLDSSTGTQVMNALIDACDTTKALIVVTHDPGIASRFQRIVRMQDGGLIDS